MENTAHFTSGTTGAVDTEILVKILCVDDQRSNLVALDVALRDSNYQLVQVGSGSEALKELAQSDFAVILLDVQMPVLDGYQTAKLIRQTERARHTPIIFLTANYPTDAHVSKGYQAGAVDYLFKPLNIEVLRAKIAVFADLFKTKVDIRELKKTEKALRQAVKVRDEFLSIASHELKTPVTPLQLQMEGIVRLMEQGKLQSLPAERLKVMVAISKAQVMRLCRVIDQLLDASRIGEGRFSIQTEPVHLNEIISSALEQLQLAIDAADCTVRLEVEPGILGNWDRFKLEQLVVNLLTNALKYSPGRPIAILGSSTPTQAVLAVTDQGIGIAPEDHVRIFERFERAVSSKNYGGLGLGLYISKQIVRLHQGEISVRSEPGKGATFVVKLPKNPDFELQERQECQTNL